MNFSLYRLNLTYLAREALRIPHGGAGNLLRGAFGAALRNTDRTAYLKLFEAVRSDAAVPSGLADLPRPFVFRTCELDARSVEAGESFQIQFHLFDVRTEWLEPLERTFERMLPARLVEIEGKDAPVVLSLDPWVHPVHRARVRFLTPTELKTGGMIVDQPLFEVLACRVRDRISLLRQLYGAGTLELDFQDFGERTRGVRMIRSELQHIARQRRSGRTGQTHPLGGFVGEAEYEGDLAEFIPFLKAAEWTGVGRQTTWGKGAISVDAGGTSLV